MYEKDKYKEMVANKGEIFETLYFASSNILLELEIVKRIMYIFSCVSNHR